MSQRFFTDTLMSRFIKRLLRTAHLPRYEYIEPGEYIVAGCKYIYEDNILICSESGIFTNDSNADNYIITNKLSESDMQTTYSYHSRFMYYDSDTHYQLGQYLRMLKARDGLNLLPFYNCFNYRMLEDVSLTNPEIPYVLDGREVNHHFKPYKNLLYKEIAIPVKFGKTYTVAIDSSTPLEYGVLIYGETGLVKQNYAINRYYSEFLTNTYGIKNSVEFTKPFTIHIPSILELQAYYGANQITDIETSLYNQQKNLYLVLQVAINNESSITVLEGDYTDSWTNPSAEFRNLKLLQLNSKNSYAFTSRLIEYLLQNVICKTDEISNNLKYFLDKIKSLDKVLFKDILIKASEVSDLEWTDEYRDLIHFMIEVFENQNYSIDQVNELDLQTSSIQDMYTGDKIHQEIRRKNYLPEVIDFDGYVNVNIEKLLAKKLSISGHGGIN